MRGYTKLFGSILASTVWELPLATKVVWITMLAMADRHGEVQASVPGLAKFAGVSREQCDAALDAFLAPDPDSRTQDADGRRIKAIDGGWRLINHEKYTRQLSPDDARERGAERQRRHRDKVRGASVEDISERDGYVCGICAKPVEPWEAEVDHIIPRSKGGPDGIGNLQLAHSFCNQSKHNGRSGLPRHSSLSPVTLLQSNKSTECHDTQTQTQTQTETKTKNGSEKRSLAPLGPPVFPPAFQAFWSGIKSPRSKGLKSEALGEWKRIGRPDSDRLIAQWNAYLASLGDTYPKDVCRWLKRGGASETYETAPSPKQREITKGWAPPATNHPTGEQKV